MFDPLRRTDPDGFLFDWLEVVATTRRAGASYVLSAIVRPQRANGFYAECTMAGMTAQREPVWAAADGVTVADGSVIWTMRAPANVTLPTITDCTYTITPSGITQSSPTIGVNTTTVHLDASAAGLGRYDIVAEATIGGEDFTISDTIEVIE